MRLFLAGIILIVVGASCNKTELKQIKYIPKEASSVISIDAKSLREKSAGDDINLDSVFSSLEREAGSETSFSEHLKDMKNSGIDTTGQFFVFAKTSGSIVNGHQQAMGFIAPLDDRSKLGNWLKKQLPEKEIKTTADYSYMALGDNFVAGWNNEVVIISFVNGGNYSPGTYSTGEGTLSQQQLTELFSLKESESVASINEFKELAAQKADIHLWTNVSGGLGAFSFLGMTKVGDLLRDMYVASTVNFETGKVVLDSKTYAGKELSDILKKYPGPGIDSRMIEQFPFNAEGFLSFSFDPRILVEILKFSGAEEFINQLAPNLGFTINDVSKAFSGEVAVVFGDIEGMAGMSKSPARFLLNAKIGDKVAYDKIIAALNEKGFMVNRDGQYIPRDLRDTGVVWSVDDKNLIIASDKNLLQQYRSGSGKTGIASGIVNEIKDKAGAFYIDLNKIMQSLPADTAYNETKEMAKASFKDVLATSDNFDGKMIKAHAELRLMNDKENSLTVILKFLKSAKMQRHRFVVKDIHLDNINDSKVEPPPPPPISGQ